MRMTRPHIGIFGRMNVGKSTLFNALAGQSASIVDDTPGTTTDPVRKTIEIEGAGPVVLIDTGGFDDTGSALGQRRVAGTEEVVNQVDLALLLFTGDDLSSYEKNLIEKFDKKNIPFILVHTKSDITQAGDGIPFSALKPDLGPLAAAIIKELSKIKRAAKNILEGLVKEKDTILLVMPIDEGAPHGRLILPQVQTIRAALDLNAVAVCAQETEVEQALAQNKNISLVITDSQAFAAVSKKVPAKIPLTSFSILLARAKGNFEEMISGAKKISSLKNGDKVLILESCAHTAGNCADIGRVKIPALLNKFTGKKLDFTITAGLDKLPDNLKDYALAVQCGGCMVTEKQLQNRLAAAEEADVPVTNYGMAIAVCTGIFDRVIRPFMEKI